MKSIIILQNILTPTHHFSFLKSFPFLLLLFYLWQIFMWIVTPLNPLFKNDVT